MAQYRAHDSEGKILPGPVQHCERWLFVDLRTGAPTKDAGWWQTQWQKLAAQGIVIPHGYAGSADATAALVAAARKAGLAVVIAVNCGVLDAATAAAHSDWVARRADGAPIEASGGLAACVNGGYFQTELPSSLRTLAASGPDGILGIGWSGLGRTEICYCAACTASYSGTRGAALPTTAKWSDAQYRDWIEWGQARRVELWKINAAAAGRSTVWSGLLPLSREAQLDALLDVPALVANAPILFADSRVPAGKGRFGSLYQDSRHLAALASDKPVVLIATTTHIGTRTFSAVSTGAAEGRLRLITAIAAGTRPAVDLGHNFAADPRALDIAPAVAQWHRTNEDHLQNLVPMGDVGVVWSSASAQVYGQAQSAALSNAPYRGFVHALMRSHVPYRSLTEDDLTKPLTGISVLVLPNVAVMTERAMEAVRAFVRDGGTLVATGHTSLFEPTGVARRNFGLSDVFGVDVVGDPPGRLVPVTQVMPGNGFGAPTFVGGVPFRGMVTDHTYLQLVPQRNGKGSSGNRLQRHPILNGFDETDFLPFGGVLSPLRALAGRTVLATFVPPFPQMPVDEIYVREVSDIPGLVVGEFGRGRVAFMPADIDRRFGIDPVPDHAALLANIIGWARGSSPPPLTIEGGAVVLSAMYRGNGTLIVHLVNLTGIDNQTGVVGSSIAVGPLRVSIVLPASAHGRAELLVSKETVEARRTAPGKDARLELTIPKITEHEIVVVS